VVSLRATASSGFRAPSLAQQFYTITTTTSRW
jgi:iron complex outermembrane receptor protein